MKGIFAAVSFLVLVTAMGAAGWLVAIGWNFLLVMLLMGAFFICLGIAIGKRPLGILVNERHLMSLSRFQIVVWTVVILAGYIALVCSRMKSGLENALAVPMDPQLWALLGISTTSLVGTPFLLSTKQSKEPDPEVVERVEEATKEPELKEIKQGTLYANAETHDAQFSDMFQGDELANTCQIDIAKVQMFFFTVVFAASYAADLFVKLSGPVIIEQFPPISNGVIALLGISHAGYLASKGVNHTPLSKR